MTNRPRATMGSVSVLGLTLLLGAWAGAQQAKGTPKAAPEKKAEPPKTLIQSVKGPDLYRAYCASCHGLDGKGGGPAARALKVQPPDLTLLARANKKAFPRSRMRQIIEGVDDVSAHGSREMPVWGPIFSQIEWDQDLGRVRVDNLVKYLESMQAR